MTRSTTVLAAAALILSSAVRADEADVINGQRLFRACAACHSLEPNRNMTGPSLAGLWNRKAGSVPNFTRYSPALKSAGIVWNDETLDRWIESPQHLVPGNAMTFPGIKDAKARSDLLAFLRQTTKSGAAVPAPGNSAGGMAGMTGGGEVPNLKRLTPEQRVETITYCGDSYRVTTANGATRVFWERNLRMKTDSSEDGPQKNAPALLRAGMMGDRADIIFASPAEISAAIRNAC
jgi:cytochrome c